MPTPQREFATRRAWEGHARNYVLCLPERRRHGSSGDLLARGAGSSIEFQDRKDYAPGDDVRRVDWRAFARNDRLSVKLYREEIRPLVDIVVDGSLSMSVTSAKRERRDEIAFFLWLLAHKLHADARVWFLGAMPRRLADPAHLWECEEQACDQPLPVLAGSRPARRSGMAIFVSDLLFPCLPEDLLSAFGMVDRLVLVQVVSRFEDDPRPAGHVRLEEAETGQGRDLQLTAETIALYLRRLNGLRDELARRLRLTGGALAIVRDEDSVAEAVDRLLRAGVIEV